MPIEGVVRWDDVSGYVDNIFKVWVSDSQYRWAEFAWGLIIKAGLANYSNDLERHIVLLRLVTLGIMYREFCEVTFEESFCIDDIVYNDWWDPDDFRAERVWQIIGADFWVDDFIDDEKEALNCAIIEISDRLRNDIYKVLSAGFGDDLRLFISMYLTAHERDDGSPIDYSLLTEQEWEGFEEAINYDTFTLWDSGGRGLYWVQIGMPRSPLENI